MANADLLAVVVAAADPAPRFGFVDRALVAGYDGGLAPVIVVTKDDLAPPDPIARSVRAAGCARGRGPPRRRPERAAGSVARAGCRC